MIPIKNYFFGKLVDGLDSHAYLHESGAEEYMISNQNARQFKYKSQRTLVDPAVRESFDFLHSSDSEIVRLFLKAKNESVYLYVRIFPSWASDRRAIRRYHCVFLTPELLETLNYNPFLLEEVLPQQITATGIVWPGKVQHTPEGDVFPDLTLPSDRGPDIIPDALVDTVIDNLARKERVFFEWKLGFGTALLSALIRTGLKSDIRIPNIFIGNALTSSDSALVRGESLFNVGILTGGGVPLVLSHWKRLDTPQPVLKRSDIVQAEAPEILVTQNEEPASNVEEPLRHNSETKAVTTGGDQKTTTEKSYVGAEQLQSLGKDKGSSNTAIKPPPMVEPVRSDSKSTHSTTESMKRSRELAKRLAHYEQLGYTPNQIEEALKSLEKSSKRRGFSLILLSLIVAGVLALAYMLYVGLEQANLQRSDVEATHTATLEEIEKGKKELANLEERIATIKADNNEALATEKNEKNRLEGALSDAETTKDEYLARIAALVEDRDNDSLRINVLSLDSLNKANRIQGLTEQQNRLQSEIDSQKGTLDSNEQTIKYLEELMDDLKHVSGELDLRVDEQGGYVLLFMRGKPYFLLSAEDASQRLPRSSSQGEQINALIQSLSKLEPVSNP